MGIAEGIAHFRSDPGSDLPWKLCKLSGLHTFYGKVKIASVPTKQHEKNYNSFNMISFDSVAVNFCVI